MILWVLFHKEHMKICKNEYLVKIQSTAPSLKGERERG